jgi:hypothetical protein
MVRPYHPDNLECHFISKEAYHYVLPVPGMRKHLLRRCGPDWEQFSFIGTRDDWRDFQRRCAFLNDSVAT